MAQARFTRLMTNEPEDSVLSGVLSGIAQYLGIEQALLRALFVIAFFMGLGGFLTIAYIVCVLSFPDYDSRYDRLSEDFQNFDDDNIEDDDEPLEPDPPKKKRFGKKKKSKLTIEENE